MTGNDTPRYCGATAHRTPLKLCRLLISSRNTDVSSERKGRHQDFGPNTPIFYRLIMKPGSGRVFHVCFIRSITLIFQQRMWITNQINQEKTCFTLSDPHPDTHYSDVVSDIRSESIWHTYIYILTFFLAYTLTFYLAAILTFYLAFYLTCVRVQAWPTASGAVRAQAWPTRGREVDEEGGDPHLAGGEKSTCTILWQLSFAKRTFCFQQGNNKLWLIFIGNVYMCIYIYIWVRYVNAILYICIICIYIYTHMWLFLVSSAMEFAGGSLRVGDPGYPSMNCAGWRPTGNHQKLTCHVVTLPHPNKKKYCASFSNIVRK